MSTAKVLPNIVRYALKTAVNAFVNRPTTREEEQYTLTLVLAGVLSHAGTKIEK